jgi:outer membrane protein
MNKSIAKLGLAKGIAGVLALLLCAWGAVAQDLPSAPNVPKVSSSSSDGQKLTLREAVTLALQNSRELRLAHVQYNVAQNEAGVDRASFLPNLYTGSGAAYTYGFPGVPGGGAPAVFQMDYQQTVFNPMLKAQQRAAEDRAKNQKLEMDATRDDVIVRTATAYLALAETRHSLDLMRSEQASAEKILQVTRDRVAANQELPIEQTRSELAAARIQQRIIVLEDRNEAYAQQLRDLTGIAEGRTLDVDAEEPSFASDLQVNAMADLALQNDRGVQEAENERLARQQILRGAHLSYWPTIDFVGQYSVLSRLNNYDQFYKNFQRNNVNIGVQITIPLFSAKTRSNVALAKSELDAAELMLGNKRQGVRVEVEQKARNVRELEAGREVARLDLKLAQESLRVVQATFDEGHATLRDLEQAQLEQSDKWVAFLDANFARQQGQLTLLQATGQLGKVFQ